ncbi:hypothetical protein, partial [Nocardia cyriacigeorgica]|uniref:hypothetical protein n=1 Tax=Nocardia cyriacigeorgica TaxID=135487 RepID=UPI0024556E6A
MSTPDGGKEITLAIRIDTARHAQLTWIAELRGTSLKAECFKAVDAYIEAAKQDPGLMARANAARAAIEEEARARQEAIDNLFIASPPPPPAQDEPDVTQAETDGPPPPPRGRRAPARGGGGNGVPRQPPGGTPGGGGGGG